MRPSSIIKRRIRRRVKKDFELPLTSMMDMLIIIVVFLLKSYSTDAVNFSASSKIQIPQSMATELPTDGAHLIIDPETISFDSERIVDFIDRPVEGQAGTGYTLAAENLADQGHRIVPLYDAMVKSREKSELIMSKGNWKAKDGTKIEKPNFQGVVIIQADKNLRYELLRKIMYTAAAAGFKVFKLVTIKKEG